MDRALYQQLVVINYFHVFPGFFFFTCCRIESEENHYRLHASGFSGTVEDSFGWYHAGQAFSTPDTGNICAEISHAGWWFHQCFNANLNGVYYKVRLNGVIKTNNINMTLACSSSRGGATR